MSSSKYICFPFPVFFLPVLHHTSGIDFNTLSNTKPQILTLKANLSIFVPTAACLERVTVFT